MGVIKGGTRSLDHGSYGTDGKSLYAADGASHLWQFIWGILGLLFMSRRQLTNTSQSEN